jgi:ParB family chromosome partitioning protein
VEIDDDETQWQAMVENLLRRDMNPIEEASAFKTLIERGYDPARIVSELGLKSTALITQRMQLLNLRPDIQTLVASGNLSATMAWGVSQVSHHRQTQLLRDIQSGRLRTSEDVKHAGIAMRDAEQQIEAFGFLPEPSKRDLRALSRLEEKVELVADMVAAGFKDGECVAAQRVDPDRVRNMAEKITLMRKHLLDMEHQLRRVAIQSEFALQPQRGNREGTQH